MSKVKHMCRTSRLGVWVESRISSTRVTFVAVEINPQLRGAFSPSMKIRVSLSNQKNWRPVFHVFLVFLSILIHPCNAFALHQAGRKMILSSSMAAISSAFTVMGSAQSSKSTWYWIVSSLFLEYPMTSYIPDSPVPGERMNCFPWRLSGLRNNWSSSAVIRLGSMSGLERGGSRLLTVWRVGCEACEALLHNT